MKFDSKYIVVIVISTLLILLSTTTTTINYIVSKKNAQEQLKTQALPLSLDNVYTEIQKNIIEPYLVSSMMANDTFVQDWIVNNEEDEKKIKEYLSTIKNKYEMFTTFLVSEKSKKYYTQDGFIEKVQEDNPNNKWYFKFKRNESKDEINLDYNINLSNSMIMFINYKIFDKSYKYLGATGVGIKIKYIDELLQMFKQKYLFDVMFFKEDGKIVLTKSNSNIKNISQLEHLKLHKNKIISKYSNFFEIKKENETYLVNTKYIPELNLYLLVEAKLSDFINDVEDVYFINLLVSIIIALIITAIIIFVIKTYNKKLEFMAEYDQLTKLMNRHSFTKKIALVLALTKRNKQKVSLAFIDIDNFKNINDTYGHKVGDKVLEKVSFIMKSSIRESDLIARWGGEEFIIAFTNCELNDSKILLEKITNSIYNDFTINNILSKSVTISVGLTSFKSSDTLDSLVNRADEGMYKAKSLGKNQIIIV